jgi:hypothetical protein
MRALRFFFMVICLAAAFACTGCAKQPTMRLNHAEVSGVSLGFPPSVGVMMTVVMDVTNPNSYDVAVRSMQGKVVFFDRYSLPVEYTAPGEGTWLAANATTQVRVPVNVPVDLAARLVGDTMASPSIPFSVTGKANVTATRSLKLEADNYSIDAKGEISRADMQSVALGMFIPH